MKRISMLILVMLIGFAHVSLAQTSRKVNKQQTVMKKAVAKKKTGQRNDAGGETVVLTSTGTNRAYGAAPARRFSIADPTINVLNQRAGGNNVPVSGSGIIGMPKGAYGFANGKILLRNTTAPSSGTMYGSGAVGTGTTIIGVGTGENAIGVNGKNPYAGPWLWGSKLPNNNLPLGDSSGRKH